MKHQPTFTGEEKCPFFLELEWLLHMMMWGVINTLPAATQPSPVWYATGQRIHRIIRPKWRKKETTIETAFVKYNEYVSILYMYLCQLCEGLCQDSMWHSCAEGSGGLYCRWWCQYACGHRFRGNSGHSHSLSTASHHPPQLCRRNKSGNLEKVMAANRLDLTGTEKIQFKSLKFKFRSIIMPNHLGPIGCNNAHLSYTPDTEVLPLFHC